jgi:hypothetical protein
VKEVAFLLPEVEDTEATKMGFAKYTPKRTYREVMIYHDYICWLNHKRAHRRPCTVPRGRISDEGKALKAKVKAMKSFTTYSRTAQLKNIQAGYKRLPIIICAQAYDQVPTQLLTGTAWFDMVGPGVLQLQSKHGRPR